MFSDFFRWFTGSRKFYVDADFQTYVSMLFVREEIPFRSVRSSEGVYSFKAFGKNVERCEKVLLDEGIPYVSGAYRGAVPFFRFIIRRPGIILGAVLFLAINYLSSHVVWNVTVNGNETMSENDVLEILEECGFTYGVFIPSVDFDSLHSRIMANHPEVAWISVNVSGTVAEVQLRETKFDERERREAGVYSNLTASEDGRLVEFHVDGGYPVKAPGDVVKKGQLIVSGVVPLRDGGSRFSDPSGEVLAEIERCVTVRAERLSEQKVYTGREKKEYSVKFFKKTLNLFSNGGKEYPCYDKIESEQRVFLFGTVPLPVWIEKTSFSEYDRVTVERTSGETLDEALSALRYETDLLIGDAELLRKKTNISVDENGVYLTCRVLVLDNIAEKREFRVE
ncbi:MAG: sporulation protein YqfD [Clostridia bacterium]|nr:sporulation protein YqfD [Clostridia bacterium]